MVITCPLPHLASPCLTLPHLASPCLILSHPTSPLYYHSLLQSFIAVNSFLTPLVFSYFLQDLNNHRILQFTSTACHSAHHSRTLSYELSTTTVFNSPPHSTTVFLLAKDFPISPSTTTFSSLPPQLLLSSSPKASLPLRHSLAPTLLSLLDP